MSPIEIVKAFDAPLLNESDGNTAMEELLKILGAKKVRYNVLDARASRMVAA